MNDKTQLDQIVFPDIADVKRGKPSNGLSIRAIIRKGLLEGRSTASIAAVVKQHFPDSAAAAKSSKHIGFYRSEMKKAGELVQTVKQVQAEKLSQAAERRGREYDHDDA